MKKILRTLMLAALLLPFASQAQNTLTVADGTTTNSYVPVYGLYVDDFVRCQTIYPASEILGAATSYYMTGGTITGLTYYLSSSAAASWGAATFVVNIKEVSATTLSAFVDMTDATTVYTGSLDATQSTMEITFTTPYTYQGGNLLIEIYNTLEGTWKSASFYGVTATDASWQGNNGTSVANITGATRAFIPKTTFTFTGGTANTCPPVENLVATNITSTTATLSWSGNATGYTVYEYANVDSADYMYTDTFAVFNTLQPNTEYTFGVVADCGADGESVMRSVSFRTACAAMSLPITEDFETVPSGSYQMPFCWNRYASAYTSTAVYPYSYSGNAHGGSRSLYFYGTTGDTYSDTMVAILPELDVNTYPMNGNRITFWAKMGAASNSKNVYVGTLTDPTDPTTFALVDSVLVSGNTYTMHSVSLGNASASAPYVALVVLKGTGSMYIDDVTLEELPSCLEISGLATSNITSNSVDLSWNDNSNPSTTTYSVYSIENGTQTLIDNNITGTNYTVTNLTPNTSYTFGVQANCAGGDAGVMTISATTACASEALPFTEDFSATLANNQCWRGSSTLYAAGVTPTLGSITGWAYQSSTNNGLPAGHYRVNIYGTSCKYWLITPSIDFTTASNPLLTFDAAFTVYTSSSSDPANTSDIADDKFMVLASTDGGSTWTVANNFDLTTLASSTYQTQYVDLSAFAGQTVRIAFYAESTVSGGDNNLHIDNISVDESTGDICYPVTNLSVVEMTSNSATISWNGTSADSYTVTVLDQSNQQVGTPLTQTDTSCVLTGLQMDNDYTVTVVANCGSDVSSASTISIHIGYCLPNPTSVDNSGITNITIGSMSNSTSHPTTSPYYINNSSMVASVPAGTTATVDITYATGYTYGTIIWVDWDNSMTFDGTEVVYAGESTNSNPTTLTATFEIPVSTTMGNYRMRIAGADSYFDNYTSSVTDAASANPCFSSSYAIVEDYTLAVTSAPSCMAVTNLTVDSVTANSVSLSWSDNENTGATYSVYSSTGTVVASGINTTNYTVTGLTASTSYTFGVVANCSATDASDVATITAVTDCAGGSCVISIYAQDGYGDGWDNSTLTISQNGATVATYNMASQGLYNTTSYDTFQVSVCSGMPVSFSWTSGSDYDDEASFAIVDGGGAIVYTVSDASTLTDGVIYTLTDACPSCNTPVITVDAATETSITISWTGNAASYNVYNGTTLVANVNTNTYTFNNLTAATSYTFGVQAICSATDSSSLATITTMTSCTDVTSLPYFEGFENGLGCWSTVNGSVDGMPWFVYDGAGLTGVVPHGGNYFASSWSWNSGAMHANAWLISPKFVLPNTSDSLIFSWYEMTNAGYPDSYSVKISTTTDDTNAFTVIRPYAVAAGSWTMQTIDLSDYAGQSVYIAFHHVDYDENYLLIDDISLTLGAAPITRDSMQVNVAVNDPTMGTTIPAPGVHYFYEGDTCSVIAVPNSGYHLEGWSVNVTAAGSVIIDTTLNLAVTDAFDLFGGMVVQFGSHNYVFSFTANFAVGDPIEQHDSLTVITGANNTAWGTLYPAAGTHYYTEGDVVVIGVEPNPGYEITAVYTSVTIPGYGTINDTIYAEDMEDEPLFDTITVDADYIGVTMSIYAVFAPIGSESYNVTIAVNDATMGTTTPAPGQYTYAAGETITVTADPYDGYKFVSWSNGSTENTITVTVNSDITLTATFAPVQGIDGVDGLNVNVYSKEGNVFVNGAEGYDVTVYDINGRTMAKTLNATETVQFRMPATGVYVVKIGNTVTKRVVVLR